MLVTASALKWRLVALDWLKPARARAISDAALRNNGHVGREAPKAVPPLLFSKPFMEVIGLAEHYTVPVRVEPANPDPPAITPWAEDLNYLRPGDCLAFADALTAVLEIAARPSRRRSA